MSAVLPATRVELRRAAMALALMLAAALLAWRMTAALANASRHDAIDLEQAIPRQFGDWRVDASVGSLVVNPQQEALLRKLYSQTLSRTYVNGAGGRIMLSIAYGNDQRDGMQLHQPEVCYPAQGFQLESNRPVTLEVAGRQVPGRQLETSFGRQRPEPVTYWTVIGQTAVRGGVAKKLVEMSYGLRGVVPDGLLFRVSSIDNDSAAAFKRHVEFSDALIGSVPDTVRARLVGADSQP